MQHLLHSLAVAVLLLVSCQASSWTSSACPCSSSGYGPLPSYENVTTRICALLSSVPVNVSDALVANINAGCVTLTKTDARATIEAVLTGKFESFINFTLVPDLNQGLLLRKQWVKSSSGTERQVLQQRWSVLLNSTIKSEQAFLDQVLNPTVSAVAKLDISFLLVNANFSSSDDICFQTIGQCTWLGKELEHWRGMLANCSTSYTCRNASDHIANITGMIKEIAPTVKFCNGSFASAYKRFPTVAQQLEEFLSGELLGHIFNLQTIFYKIRNLLVQSPALSQLLTQIHLGEALATLDSAVALTKKMSEDKCAIVALPCARR